jgi:CheY-like chemotaxis protein
MAMDGPVLVLEDDKEDKEILEAAFRRIELKNKRLYFDTGNDMLAFLLSSEEKPFVILSNVKVRGMDGIELREKIQHDQYLHKKGIPFVFLSLDTRKNIIEKAYDLTVQGFFEKEDTIEGVERQLRMIVEYWQQCKHPNA